MKPSHRRLGPSLVLAVALAGCRGRDVDAPMQLRAPATAPPVSFCSDVLPVIVEYCADADGCHGNKPTDSIDLDLRAVAAYSQLVNKASNARKGAIRVKPGDPAASFLIDKLQGSLRSNEGKPMPLDVRTGVPISPSPLPPDYIQKRLWPWISAGALNN